MRIHKTTFSYEHTFFLVVEPVADENRNTIVADSLIALAIGMNNIVGSAILTAVDETKKVVAMIDLKIMGCIRV